MCHSALSSFIYVTLSVTMLSRASFHVTLSVTVVFLVSFHDILSVTMLSLVFISCHLICHSALIGFVDDATAFTWQGYVYAVALFAVTCLRGIVLQQHFFGKHITTMRVRTSLMTAVYRKVREI